MKKKVTKKITKKPAVKLQKTITKTTPKEEDFFEVDFYNPFDNFFKPIHVPNTDIEDKGKELEVVIDLPGIDKKDIKINVQKNFLEINAERKLERKSEKKNYFSQERSFSGFYRRFVLPTSVDANKTQCSYNNGVLKISLPKLQEKKDKVKTITLK